MNTYATAPKTITVFQTKPTEKDIANKPKKGDLKDRFWKYEMEPEWRFSHGRFQWVWTPQYTFAQEIRGLLCVSFILLVALAFFADTFDISKEQYFYLSGVLTMYAGIVGVLFIKWVRNEYIEFFKKA